MRLDTEGLIPVDHPAIPGHFPGRPVVPGVVLLAEVLRAVRAALSDEDRVTGLPAVKFLAPLRPGEAFRVRVRPAGDGLLDFSVTRDGQPVAAGRLRVGR